MHSAIPSSGSVVNWLRNEARQPFFESRGDAGDVIALQWLPPIADADARVCDAIVELLGEGDALVTTRLLQVAASPDATAPLRAAVARAIAQHRTTLGGVQIAAEQTALGLAVYAMWPPPPLADDSLDGLHEIQRVEDGWPLSLRAGIVADLSRFADRVVGDFTRMSDREQRDVLRGVLVHAAESTIADLFALIARDGEAVLAARVAYVTKATLDELDEARALAAEAGTKLPGDDGATRWSRYATALGCPGDV